MRHLPQSPRYGLQFQPLQFADQGRPSFLIFSFAAPAKRWRAVFFPILTNSDRVRIDGPPIPLVRHQLQAKIVFQPINQRGTIRLPAISSLRLR